VGGNDDACSGPASRQVRKIMDLKAKKGQPPVKLLAFSILFCFRCFRATRREEALRVSRQSPAVDTGAKVSPSPTEPIEG